MLARQCCLQLWQRASDCPSVGIGQAAAALAGVLRAHPGDGCITQCACAALTRLASSDIRGHRAALLPCLPTLDSVLCCPTLPPAAICQAALCLRAVLRLHISPVLSAGLARHVAQLLQWRTLPEVQLCAVALLAQMEDCDLCVLASLEGCEVIQPLARLLDSPLALARLEAMYLLGHFARVWPGAVHAVLDAQVLPHLLRALHPLAATQLVSSATPTLISLCQCSPCPSLASARAMLPLLTALLTLESGGVMHVVSALLCLCKGGEGYQQAVLEAGCLPHLVALLGQSPSRLLAKHIISTLHALALADTLRLQAVLSAGPLPCIAALLLRRGRAVLGSYHGEACSLLDLACTGTHSQAQAVLQAGCMQGLIRTVHKGCSELALRACLVLAQLAVSGSQQQVQQLAGMGGVAPLCMVLGLCSAARNRYRLAGIALLEALRAMLRMGVPAEVLLQAGAGKEAQRLAGVHECARRLRWELGGVAGGL